MTHNDLRRRHKRFLGFIIAVQMLIVVAIVWMITHPETIGSWIGRLLGAAS